MVGALISIWSVVGGSWSVVGGWSVGSGFVPRLLGSYTFISDEKKSRQKAIETEIAFCHSLGNPKSRTLDHSFYAPHIRHNFPYKLIPILTS